MAAPYPTAAEVTAGVSDGSPRLGQDPYNDTWIDRQVALFAEKLEAYTGDSYGARSGTFTQTVPSATTKLLLPVVNVASVTSVTVNGTAVTIDTQQPELAAGIIYYSGGFQAGQKIVTVCSHGTSKWAATVNEAAIRFVERVASLDRSTNTRDVSQRGFDGGAATVFMFADPKNGKLTGFPEVDDLVRTLPRYVIPGIA